MFCHHIADVASFDVLIDNKLETTKNYDSYYVHQKQTKALKLQNYLNIFQNNQTLCLSILRYCTEPKQNTKMLA